MEKEKPVGFRDLSTSLQVLVVLTWIALVGYLLLFMLGFMLGAMGVE